MGRHPRSDRRSWAICRAGISLPILLFFDLNADGMPKVAKLCGFKVLGSCSPANSKLVESIGADATFNYKVPAEEQIKEIGRITGGKFSRVFDASGFSPESGMGALTAYTDPDEEKKYFSTTNDWSGTHCYRAQRMLTNLGCQLNQKRVSRST